MASSLRPEGCTPGAEIIKNDLHCNAVSISARDVGRIVIAATAALEQGLEVWLSPSLWDKSENETVAYLAKAAGPFEALRKKWPDKVVLSVSGESTLFMQGILPGKNIVQRLRSPKFRASIMSGEHNAPLNAFLAKAVAAVRKEFKGKLTYHSLIWEKVDWSLFDYVGVDHYRAQDIEDKYVEMLKPLFDTGKVVVTEFGYNTYQSDGKLVPVILGGGDTDFWSQFFHALPVVGTFVRPKVRVIHPRDEAWQARKLVETLEILDAAGVGGAFVSHVESQTNPFDEDPKYRLGHDEPESGEILRGWEARDDLSRHALGTKRIFQSCSKFLCKSLENLGRKMLGISHMIVIRAIEFSSKSECGMWDPHIRSDSLFLAG